MKVGRALLNLGACLDFTRRTMPFALLVGRSWEKGRSSGSTCLHCVGLPLGIAVLMAVHFWRVEKTAVSLGALDGLRRTA